MPDLFLLNVIQYALLGLTFAAYYYDVPETYELGKFTFSFILGIAFAWFCFGL